MKTGLPNSSSFSTGTVSADGNLYFIGGNEDTFSTAATS